LFNTLKYRDFVSKINVWRSLRSIFNSTLSLSSLLNRIWLQRLCTWGSENRHFSLKSTTTPWQPSHCRQRAFSPLEFARRRLLVSNDRRRPSITVQFNRLQRQVHALAGHSVGQHAFGIVRIRLSGHHFHCGNQENVVQVCVYIFPSAR